MQQKHPFINIPKDWKIILKTKNYQQAVLMMEQTGGQSTLTDDVDLLRSFMELKNVISCLTAVIP